MQRLQVWRVMGRVLQKKWRTASSYEGTSTHSLYPLLRRSVVLKATCFCVDAVTTMKFLILAVDTLLMLWIPICSGAWNTPYTVSGSIIYCFVIHVIWNGTHTTWRNQRTISRSDKKNACKLGTRQRIYEDRQKIGERKKPQEKGVCQDPLGPLETRQLLFRVDDCFHHNPVFFEKTRTRSSGTWKRRPICPDFARKYCFVGGAFGEIFTLAVNADSWRHIAQQNIKPVYGHCQIWTTRSFHDNGFESFLDFWARCVSRPLNSFLWGSSRRRVRLFQ